MTLRNRDVVNKDYEEIQESKLALVNFLKQNTLKAFEKATGETLNALKRLNNSNSGATKIDDDLQQLIDDQQALNDAVMSVKSDSANISIRAKKIADIFSGDRSNNEKSTLTAKELKEIEVSLGKMKEMRVAQEEKFDPICDKIATINGEIIALAEKLQAENQLQKPKNDVGHFYSALLIKSIEICDLNKRIIKLRSELFNIVADGFEEICGIIDDNENKLIPLIKQRIADLQNRANNTATTAHVQSTLQSQQPKTVSGSSKPVPVKAVSAVTPTAVKQAIPSSSSTGKQASNGLQITTNGKPLQGALYATPTQQTKPLTHPVAAQKQISVKP